MFLALIVFLQFDGVPGASKYANASPFLTDGPKAHVCLGISDACYIEIDI